MKKLAIAGASIALAAMPIVSTFALREVTDHLTVTVSPQCQLGTITPAPEQGQPAENYWYAVNVNPGDPATSFVAGTSSTQSGGTATSIQINCNAASGYKITPDFSALHMTGASDTSQDITYGGLATPAAGTWTAYYKLGDNGAVTNFADETPITGQPSMTDVYTFSYKVTPSANQAAGTYEGTAVYTLAENS